MNNKTNLLPGVLITLLAYFFIAISNACVRVLPSTFPVSEIAFFQNFICLIFFIPYCMKKKTFNLHLSNLHIHLLRDIAAVLCFLTSFWAIQKLGLVDATVLILTAPFFVPFIWKWMTKDPIEKDVWITIILGFFGILTIFKPQNILQINSLIGIASAIFSALALCSLKILNQRKEPISRTLLYVFAVGSIVSLAFALPEWQMPTFSQWIVLISIGLFYILVQTLLTLAYQYGTASFLTPLSYSSLIYAALISWLFFHLFPSWNTWLGIFLILMGGTLSYVLRTLPKRKEVVIKNDDQRTNFEK